MAEEWKSINGYESIYEVSSTGKIRSVDRTIKRKSGSMKVRGRLLSPSLLKHPQGKGLAEYYVVTLSKNGKSNKFLVHRLVAEAFIPNPHNKPHVNHIDGNGRNNSVDNLEWVTPSENMVHAWNSGIISQNVRERLSIRSKEYRGKNNPNWKGFCAIIDSNGNDVQLCETLKEAQNWIRQNTNWKNARLSHIGEVCQGKAKQAYGFRYEYRKNK